MPYPETAVPAPATAYGRTKLAGEQAVAQLLPGRSWILRTAWLYGAHGRSFVATMIGLAARQPEVTVVDDQHGQPTSTVTVAGLILALVAADAPAGIYHATCSGQTTWFGLAQEVFRLLGADPGRVTPIPSSAADPARAAARPAAFWATAPGRGGPARRRRTGGPPCTGTSRPWPRRCGTRRAGTRRPGDLSRQASTASAAAREPAARSRADTSAGGRGHGMARSGSSNAMATSSRGSCGRSMR